MEQTKAATKANLISSKKTLRLALTGQDLMDRKAGIIRHRMKALAVAAASLREERNQAFSLAYSMLQKANIMLGICTRESKAIPFDENVTLTDKSQMGIKLVEITHLPPETDIYYGLENTAIVLDDAYLLFTKAKEAAIRASQTEENLYRLGRALDKTQKRANALKNVVIPRLEKTVAAITSALEEKEREEFSRLKNIKKV